MKTPQPFFSILIPSFNRPNYLKEAIDSVYENSFSDFEILVSDNCSNNPFEILSVIDQFKSNDNFIFYRQDLNIGWSDNWNFLVSMAKGKFVILMGDDDKLLPHSLARIRWYITSYNHTDIFAFGYNVIGNSGEHYYSIRGAKPKFISSKIPRISKKLFNADILPFALFHPLTMAYKRELHEVLKYNRDAGIGSDYLFLFEAVITNKEILIIPEVLFSWRKTFFSESKLHKNLSSTELNIEARKNILAILRNKNSLPPYLMQHINRSSYYKRFILEPIISHKKLWDRGRSNSIISSQDFQRLRFKLNWLFHSYLLLRRMVEKIFLLGIYSTCLNVKANFKRR